MPKYQKGSEDFDPCPGACLLHRGGKGEGNKKPMEEISLEHIDPEAATTALEAKWDNETQQVITKHKKSAERGLAELERID